MKEIQRANHGIQTDTKHETKLPSCCLSRSMITNPATKEFFFCLVLHAF